MLAHPILLPSYGPTETAVCVLAKNRLTAKTELDDLGRPLGANSIYVLDGRRRLVLLGCVGELCISGP
jgi:non-ribosomal peptide synthetase component F